MNGLYPFGLSVIALGVDRVYVLLLNHCAERAAAFSIRTGAVCVLSHEPRRNWIGGSWTSMSYEHRWPIAYCPFTPPMSNALRPRRRTLVGALDTGVLKDSQRCPNYVRIMLPLHVAKSCKPLTYFIRGLCTPGRRRPYRFPRTYRIRP